MELIQLNSIVWETGVLVVGDVGDDLNQGNSRGGDDTVTVVDVVEVGGALGNAMLAILFSPKTFQNLINAELAFSSFSKTEGSLSKKRDTCSRPRYPIYLCLNHPKIWIWTTALEFQLLVLNYECFIVSKIPSLTIAPSSVLRDSDSPGAMIMRRTTNTTQRAMVEMTNMAFGAHHPQPLK